jgi:hypothetical protein
MYIQLGTFNTNFNSSQRKPEFKLQKYNNIVGY